MDSESDIRQKFLESVMNLVDQGIDALGREGVAEVLWESLVELDPSTYRFEPRYETREGIPTLTLQYRTGLSLRRDVENLVDVGGLMVDVEPVPPLMESMEVVVTAREVDDEVRLSGRAVHRSDDGVAVELSPEGAEPRRELTELAGRIETSGSGGPGPETLASSLASETSSGEDVSEVSEVSEVEDEDDESLPIVDRLLDHSGPPEKRWSLSEVEPRTMLMEWADVDDYGVVELCRSNETVQFLLHDGKLVDVRRDPPVDSNRMLTEKLVEMGEIGDEELERADVLASIHDIPVQDALVDMECVTLETVLKAIRKRLVDDLEAIWEVEEGEARLFLLESRPPLKLRRSSVDLVEETVRHRRRSLAEGGAEVREAFRRKMGDRRVERRRPMPVDIDRMGLDEQRRRFLEVVLDEPRSLFELERISNLRDDETLEMLALLEEFEMLEWSGQAADSPRRERIEQLHSTLAGRDHFEVLGVHWSAHGDEIDAAYRKLRDQLDVSDRLQTELSEELEDLREAVSRAYGVLSDPQRRRAYRNRQVDRSARSSALNVYRDKADTQEMREDKTDLLDTLRRIVELDPDDDQARRKLRALEQRGD